MAGEMTDPRRLVKAPAEVRNFYVDFQAYEELQIEGQTLTGTPTVTVSPTGPTIGTPTISGTSVVAQISGGTAGISYAVRYTVSTSGSKTLSRVLLLDVKDI